MSSVKKLRVDYNGTDQEALTAPENSVGNPDPSSVPSHSSIINEVTTDIRKVSIAVTNADDVTDNASQDAADKPTEDAFHNATDGATSYATDNPTEDAAPPVLVADVLDEIFSYLSLSDLLRCAQVSRRWNEHILSSIPSPEFAASHFPRASSFQFSFHNSVLVMN